MALTTRRLQWNPFVPPLTGFFALHRIWMAISGYWTAWKFTKTIILLGVAGYEPTASLVIYISSYPARPLRITVNYYLFHGLATQLISLSSFNTEGYSGVKILAESDRIGVRSLHYRSQQPCCLFVMNTRTGYIITQLEDKWFFPPHMTPTRELKKEGTFGSFNWLPDVNCFCDNNLACVKKKSKKKLTNTALETHTYLCQPFH